MEGSGAPVANRSCRKETISGGYGRKPETDQMRNDEERSTNERVDVANERLETYQEHEYGGFRTDARTQMLDTRTYK